MAIGSAPPPGEKFRLWGQASPEEQQEWFDKIKREWYPYLMAGYATLVHKTPNKYYKGDNDE